MLFLILIVKDVSFVLFDNIPFTILFIEIIETVSIIIGGVLQLKYLNKASLKLNMIFELFVFVVYMINVIFFKNLIILIILTIISGYLAGISNPKLDTYILKTVPENNQASIYSIFGTLITLSVPIGTILFVFISNVASYTISLYVLLVLAIILLSYSFTFKNPTK